MASLGNTRHELSLLQGGAFYSMRWSNTGTDAQRGDELHFWRYSKLSWRSPEQPTRLDVLGAGCWAGHGQRCSDLSNSETRHGSFCSSQSKLVSRLNGPWASDSLAQIQLSFASQLYQHRLPAGTASQSSVAVWRKGKAAVKPPRSQEK